MKKLITKILPVKLIMNLFGGVGDVINTTEGYRNANTGATTAFDANGYTLDPTLKTYYDTELLENARDKRIYAQFGQKQALPKNHGKTVEWRKWKTLPPAMKALVEGVNPKGRKLGETAITKTISQHGDYVEKSDVLDLHALDNVGLAATEELGSAAAQTQDLLIRNELMQGTNVLIADKVYTDDDPSHSGRDQRTHQTRVNGIQQDKGGERSTGDHERFEPPLSRHVLQPLLKFRAFTDQKDHFLEDFAQASARFRCQGDRRRQQIQVFARHAVAHAFKRLGQRFSRPVFPQQDRQFLLHRPRHACVQHFNACAEGKSRLHAVGKPGCQFQDLGIERLFALDQFPVIIPEDGKESRDAESAGHGHGNLHFFNAEKQLTDKKDGQDDQGGKDLAGKEDFRLDEPSQLLITFRMLEFQFFLKILRAHQDDQKEKKRRGGEYQDVIDVHHRRRPLSFEAQR